MTAANNEQWYPEWMILGDVLTAGNLMSAEPSNEMANAWNVTSLARLNANGQAVEQACWDALLEVDPSIPKGTDDPIYACGGIDGYMFDDVRQLFIGIQLAGPHLTPQSMDQGFHAIPPKPSDSPFNPACYYLPSDYSCVKDGVAEWFDPTTAQPSSESSGCWRMWENGFRYLPGHWPAGDITQGKDPSDVCNLYGGGLQPANVRST